jgi:hypothetical protein
MRRQVRGAPRVSAEALEQFSVLLRELGFDTPATAAPARSQEVADEAEPMLPPATSAAPSS